MKWILTLLVFLIPSTVHAQSPEYKSGLQHARVYNTPKPTKPDTPDVEKPELAATSDKAEDKEQTAADRVWEKYKAIAMGEHTKEKEKEKETEKENADKAETPEKEAKTEVAEDKPSKEGFAKILDSYNSNKESQRDMRSISFKTPKADAVNDTQGNE